MRGRNQGLKAFRVSLRDALRVSARVSVSKTFHAEALLEYSYLAFRSYGSEGLAVEMCTAELQGLRSGKGSVTLRFRISISIGIGLSFESCVQHPSYLPRWALLNYWALD